MAASFASLPLLVKYDAVDAAGQLLGQLLAELPDRGVQVDGGRVLQLADLLADALDDLRMAVPDADGDDSGEGIEIPLARFVVHILHVAFDDQQRVFVVGHQARREVLAAAWPAPRLATGHRKARACG